MMKNTEIVGEAGAGLVKVTYRNNVPVKVEIDDLVFKESEKQLVSDLFVAALVDAENKMAELARLQYKSLGQSPTFAELLGHLSKPNKEE